MILPLGDVVGRVYVLCIANYKPKASQKLLTLPEREALYAAARKEYEQGGDSLLAVAQKHGLSYSNLQRLKR